MGSDRCPAGGRAAAAEPTSRPSWPSRSAAFGPSDEPGVRAHLGDPGHPGRLGGGGRPGRRADRLRLGAAGPPHGARRRRSSPAGRSSTWPPTPTHQRRGLVRAQFDWHHRRSVEPGATWPSSSPASPTCTGASATATASTIPSSACPPGPIVAPRRRAGADRVDAATGHRPAIRAAIVAIDAGRDPAPACASSATPPPGTSSSPSSRDNPYEHLTVAERDGRVVGWMRTQHKPGRRAGLPAAVAGGRPTSRRRPPLALVAAARAEAGDDVLVVFDSPDTTYGRHLARARPSSGPTLRHDHGIYVRVPDPVALLDRLRPVLSAPPGRLALRRRDRRAGHLPVRRAAWPSTSTAGEVRAVRAVPGVEDPFADGGVGVAPDLFGALVFGRFGAIGLEQRADDVTLGRHRGLMEVLFPQFERRRGRRLLIGGSARPGDRVRVGGTAAGSSAPPAVVDHRPRAPARGRREGPRRCGRCSTPSPPATTWSTGS